MKKLSQIILCFVMVFVMSLSLVSCKNNDDNTPNTSINTSVDNGSQGGNNGGGGNQGSGDIENPNGDGEDTEEPSDDNQGENPENPPSEEIEKNTLSVDEFLSEMNDIRFDFTNILATISNYDIESEETTKTFALMNVSYTTDETTTYKNYKVQLGQGEEIIAFMNESIILSQGGIKTNEGIVIDNVNKLYYYINDFKVSDEEIKSYITYSRYALLQNLIVAFDNETIVDGAFIENFETTMLIYANDLSITKSEFDGIITYVVNFNTENGEECSYSLVSSNNMITNIYIGIKSETNELFYEISEDVEQNVVQIPALDGTFAQENYDEEE